MSTKPPEDLELNGKEIVDIALSNNPLTQNSWFAARANAFQYLSSQGALYPTITYDGTLSISNSNGGGNTFSTDVAVPSDPTVDSVTVNNSNVQGLQATVLHEIALSYLLYDFGGRDADIESARQALIASNWSHDREIQTVIVNSMTNYFNYLSQRALVDAKRSDLEDTQKTLDAAQKQFDAGVVAKIDVLQASANHASAQYTLESQISARDIAMSELATSMGLPADTKLTIGPPPEDLEKEKVEEDVEYLLWIAKQQRPDFKESYASFVQSWANMQAAWSAGMPTLTGGFSYNKFVNIHNPINNSWGWVGSVTLNIPVFNGYSDYYNYRTAKELVQATWAQYRANELAILQEVMTSYLNYRAAKENIKNSDEFYKFSQEAYDVAYNSYKGGVATILDVLTAQSKLAAARSLRIQARTNLAVSLAALAYSTGVLYR